MMNDEMAFPVLGDYYMCPAQFDFLGCLEYECRNPYGSPRSPLWPQCGGGSFNAPYPTGQLTPPTGKPFIVSLPHPANGLEPIIGNSSPPIPSPSQQPLQKALTTQQITPPQQSQPKPHQKSGKRSHCQCKGSRQKTHRRHVRRKKCSVVTLYRKTTKSLIGVRSSYSSGLQINRHHRSPKARVNKAAKAFKRRVFNIACDPPNIQPTGTIPDMGSSSGPQMYACSSMYPNVFCACPCFNPYACYEYQGPTANPPPNLIYQTPPANPMWNINFY